MGAEDAGRWLCARHWCSGVHGCKVHAFLTYWFFNVAHIGTKKALFLQHNGSHNKARLRVRLLATSGKGPAPQGMGCKHWTPFLWAASWGLLVLGTLPPGGTVGAGDGERGWGCRQESAGRLVGS